MKKIVDLRVVIALLGIFIACYPASNTDRKNGQHPEIAAAGAEPAALQEHHDATTAGSLVNEATADRSVPSATSKRTDDKAAPKKNR